MCACLCLQRASVCAVRDVACVFAINHSLRAHTIIAHTYHTCCPINQVYIQQAANKQHTHTHTRCVQKCRRLQRIRRWLATAAKVTTLLCCVIDTRRADAERLRVSCACVRASVHETSNFVWCVFWQSVARVFIERIPRDRVRAHSCSRLTEKTPNTYTQCCYRRVLVGC